MNNELISGEPVNESQETLGVGEEFFEWAEKHWGLDTIIKTFFDRRREEGSEIVPYDYLRQTFIGKINNIIRERMGI